MPKFKTKEEAYESCLVDGYFRNLSHINKERAKSLIVNADTNIDSANTLAQSLSKEDKRWMTVYILHYEAIRMCAEAFLVFEKIMSENHQCLFAYLCFKNPEPGFDWNFFEEIRRKRNGVNYYGEHVSYDDWKAVEPQFNLYVTALKKEIERKLSVVSER